MRAIWSGSIAFGLVNIPVKLYSGTQAESGLQFTMLEKHDLCPIGYAKVCKHDHKEVKWEDIVKGYEFRKGEYVVLNEEDFKRAHAHKTSTIDIAGFVKPEEIDQMYYVKPYFLEPDKKAAKAYVLLREALEQTGKVAIAKFVLKEKEHIGAIKPDKEMLVLDQLRYESEIRDPSELKIPESMCLEKAELKMAMALINQLTEKFVPATYKDTYTQELKKVIEAKAKGKSVKINEEESKPTEVSDIMAMLKESLEKKKVKA